MIDSKLLSLESFSSLRKKFKEKKIVLCHGVFDLLHIGHIDYLESAKKFGDILIVSITSDRFVNKGHGRPYFNEYKRAKMLLSLKIVNLSFNSLNKKIKILSFNIFNFLPLLYIFSILLGLPKVS